MRHIRFVLPLLTVVVALLAFPVSGFCATQQLTSSQVQTLKEINTKIAVVHELAERNIITAAQEQAADTQFV